MYMYISTYTYGVGNVAHLEFSERLTAWGRLSFCNSMPYPLVSSRDQDARHAVEGIYRWVWEHYRDYALQATHLYGALILGCPGPGYRELADLTKACRAPSAGAGAELLGLRGCQQGCPLRGPFRKNRQTGRRSG